MSKRVEKWDILKFGLIFLVVLGHICDIYIKESAAVRAIWLLSIPGDFTPRFWKMETGIPE